MARAIAIAAIVMAGCAAKAPGAASAPAAGAASATAAGSAAEAGAASATATAPGATMPTLAELAARGETIAPGMHEIARGELTSDGARTATVVREAPSDLCVRVTLVAEPPVHATLVHGHAADLLDEAPDAGDTAMAPRGPVCVRKSDTIELRLDGAGRWRARFVAWASGG